ncbi:MAG: hypothetical protein HKN17_08835 [Rhodothermales bacterium]|nr:hypothetical protein [Rhodothermales bacterium]
MKANSVDIMLGMRLRAWLPALLLLEVGAAFIAIAAMGERTAYSPGQGDRIVRIVLDNPGPVESFLFYFLAVHILVFLFYTAAKLFARP